MISHIILNIDVDSYLSNEFDVCVYWLLPDKVGYSTSSCPRYVRETRLHRILFDHLICYHYKHNTLFYHFFIIHNNCPRPRQILHLVSIFGRASNYFHLHFVLFQANNDSLINADSVRDFMQNTFQERRKLSKNNAEGVWVLFISHEIFTTVDQARYCWEFWNGAHLTAASAY